MPNVKVTSNPKQTTLTWADVNVLNVKDNPSIKRITLDSTAGDIVTLEVERYLDGVLYNGDVLTQTDTYLVKNISIEAAGQLKRLTEVEEILKNHKEKEKIEKESKERFNNNAINSLEI